MPYNITCSTKISNFGNITIFLFQLICSVNSLWCQVCTFYCPLRKKRCTFLPEGTDVHIQKHIYEKDLNLFLPLFYYTKVIVELQKHRQRIKLCYAYGAYNLTKQHFEVPICFQLRRVSLSNLFLNNFWILFAFILEFIWHNF